MRCVNGIFLHEHFKIILNIMQLNFNVCISKFLTGWSDLGANFFLDASGRYYESRSWVKNSAYLSVTSRGGTEGFGFHIAITLFGDYHTATPSLDSRVALRSFCACAVEQGHVTKSYTVLSHVGDRPASTYCPGQAMIDMIQQWPLI